MQIATRGGSEHLLNFQLPTISESKVETKVIIHANESNMTAFLKAQEITLSAISVGLSVTTEKQSDEIRLIIKGFTKLNPELIPINSVLGLSNQTQGNVSVLILE
jgi:secreted Zn-dependent insulinase-like peptidase